MGRHHPVAPVCESRVIAPPVPGIADLLFGDEAIRDLLSNLGDGSISEWFGRELERPHPESV
jgi:hypothetical protein